MNKMNSIVEAVNGAWEIFHENREWIPQVSIMLQECKSSGGVKLPHRGSVRRAVTDVGILCTDQPQQRLAK